MARTSCQINHSILPGPSSRHAGLTTVIHRVFLNVHGNLETLRYDIQPARAHEWSVSAGRKRQSRGHQGYNRGSFEKRIEKCKNKELIDGETGGVPMCLRCDIALKYRKSLRTRRPKSMTSRRSYLGTRSILEHQVPKMILNTPVLCSSVYDSLKAEMRTTAPTLATGVSTPRHMPTRS